MINPILESSFENIKYQQEKMDNKAYIFIGFIGFIFTTLLTVNNNLSKIYIYLILTIIPLILSLIPIATDLLISIMTKCNEYFFRNSGKNKDNFNLFYYIFFYNFETQEFIKLFKKNYEVDFLSKADIFLIDQILINAKILKIKIFFHSISQFIVLIILTSNLLSFIAI